MAAVFGRHGMPPPASNDTGTAFCFPNEEEAEIRQCELVTLTFDLEAGAQCSTCRGVLFCQFW